MPSPFASALCLAALNLLSPAITLAAPITYFLSFTVTVGVAPTSGSFTYDAADLPNAFSNFNVTWSGNTYDLAFSANSYHLINPDCPAPNGPAGAFGILSGSTDCGAGRSWFALSLADLSSDLNIFTSDAAESIFLQFGIHNQPGLPGPFSRGHFTISPLTADAPEPATVATTLIGFASLGLLAARKRKSSPVL